MFPKKLKMLQAPIPVCSCCTRATERSISCTECRQICCARCLGISGSVFESKDEAAVVLLRTVLLGTDPVCRKCNGTVTIQPPPQPEVAQLKQERMEVASEPEVTVDRETCTRHRKPRKLFCLNCWEPMCGDCFGSEERHAHHRVDNLAALYQEKRRETEQKLARVTKAIGALQGEVALADKNLSIIEERKRSVLYEIERICAQAKEDVNQLTSGRISKIQSQKDGPAEKQQRLLALQGTVQQLHPEDFLKQSAEINRQSEALLANNVAKGFVPIVTTDIGW